jgi:hypothetical protein
VPRYQFQRRARAALLDQLAAAGLPGLPVEMDGDYRPDGTIVNDTTCWVTCAPEQFDAVAGVVSAHDAAALDAAAAQAAGEDQADRDLARTMYAALLADVARLEDTTVTMTAQVYRNHLARTDRVLAAVLRRLRRAGIL